MPFFKIYFALAFSLLCFQYSSPVLAKNFIKPQTAQFEFTKQCQTSKSKSSIECKRIECAANAEKGNFSCQLKGFDFVFESFVDYSHDYFSIESHRPFVNCTPGGKIGTYDKFLICSNDYLIWQVNGKKSFLTLNQAKRNCSGSYVGGQWNEASRTCQCPTGNRPEIASSILPAGPHRCQDILKYKVTTHSSPHLRNLRRQELKRRQ